MSEVLSTRYLLLTMARLTQSAIWPTAARQGFTRYRASFGVIAEVCNPHQAKNVLDG